MSDIVIPSHEYYKAVFQKEISDNTKQIFIETFHHPWCNFYWKPRKNCKMCDGPNGLWALYPLEDGMTFDDLMTKHFPNNIIRR